MVRVLEEAALTAVMVASAAFVANLVTSEVFEAVQWVTDVMGSL